MLIPIRTDYRMSIKPWVNYGLLAVNIALFLLGLNSASMPNYVRIQPLLLHPDAPQLHQFFSSMFLHANWGHLLGNMVFLWVFGAAINDRLGHVGYLCFYLAGGLLAGVGYVIFAGTAPVLGASGAISAVTGAYLVLFPRTRVLTLAFVFYIIPLEITSLVFIGLQVVWNLYMSWTPAITGRAAGGVAYVAHSSGYIFGIVLAAALLWLRVLPRDVFDLLSLIRGAHRRAQYRRMVSKGYDPFRGTASPTQAPPPPPGGSRRVDARTVSSEPSHTASQRELDLRRDVRQACARQDLETASAKYLQLVQIAEDAVLSRQDQLDVANQLMATQRYPAAADAYERFRRHYRNYEHMGDIHLMLGLLYGRYLHQYDRAVQRLQDAADRLHDERKIRLAKEELAAAQKNA